MKTATPNSKFLKIQGKYNYYLYASIKGEAPYQSSTMIINVFTNESKKVPLNFTCKFYRIKKKNITPLLGLDSQFYNLSASDIGCILKVEVFLVEKSEYFYGTAELFYGPIQFEPNLKYTLENILAIGGSKFPITIFTENNRNQDFKNDCSFLLTNDHIRLISNSETTLEKEKSVKFKYYLGHPKLIVNNNNPNLLQLFFHEDDDNEDLKLFFNIDKNVKNFEIIIQTSSRTTKDLIISALRCFSVKNYLINSKAITNINNFFENEEKDNNFKLDGHYDLITELESLKNEIFQLSENNKEISRDKISLSKEVKFLEEELEKTIQTYTNMINEMKKGNFTVNESLLDISILGKKEEIEFRKKNKFLEQENQNLINKIKALSNQIDLLQNFNKNKGFFDETQCFQNDIGDESNNEKKIIELEKLNKELKTKLEEFKINCNPQLLEKKYVEAKKLNTLLLEEIANYKLNVEGKKQNDYSLNQKEIIQMEEGLKLEKEKNQKLINEMEEKQRQILAISKALKEKENEFSFLKNKYEEINREYDIIKNKNTNEDKNAILQLKNALEESIKKNNQFQKEIEEFKNKEKFPSFQHQNLFFPSIANEEIIKALKNEIQQLKEQIQSNSQQNMKFNGKIIQNSNNLDQINLTKLLEIELKHMKIEQENSLNKILKYEEKIHALDIEINEEKNNNDALKMESKNLKLQFDTVKAENDFFQNENNNLLEDRKKKMEKIINLETENRMLKSSSSSFYLKNDNNEVKELKTKNLYLVQEIDELKKEKHKLIEKVTSLKNIKEDPKISEELYKKNQNLESLNEDLNFQISDLQFQVNCLNNEINVMKTYKIHQTNPLEYEKLVQENSFLKSELETYKNNENAFKSKINYQISNLENIDTPTKEIIENLQNEKKALQNKIESIQKELIKLQKNNPNSNFQNLNEKNENFYLKKKVSELEGEIIMMKERSNLPSQPKPRNVNRSIFS